MNPFRSRRELESTDQKRTVATLVSGSHFIWATLVVTFAISFASLASALPPEGQVNPSTDLDRDTRVDANTIDMYITNHGSFGYNISSGVSGLTFPKGSDLTALFAGGLWMGGRVNGQVRVAVAEYSWEYQPGQILSPSTWSDPDDPSYRVYKISPGDTPASNPDYAEWPADQGAPVDQNGDPRHLGRQTLWSVYHDLDPSSHANDAGSTAPLGVEVQQTSFASDLGGASDFIVLMEWKIINKGPNRIEDAYVSIWSDPELGEASGDLVGCDPSESVAFCYQAHDADRQYGVSPPTVGFQLIQGPIVPSPGDHAYVSGEIIPDYRNLPMTSFVKYINGTDPSSAQESYNYMQGLESNGDPIVDPTTGEVTPYMMSGDPVTGTGWLDSDPSDRRMMLSAGPFTMAPGEEQTVAVAVLIGQGNDRLGSISVLRENAELASALFRSAHGDEDGACCAEGETCRITNAADCTEGFFRIGEPCDPDPCGIAMGACCFDNGICLLMFAEDCSGDYQGDASVCTPGICRVYGPSFACCLGNGACEVLPERECLDRGGSYHRDSGCLLLPPGLPRGWQRTVAGNLMIDETATAGGGRVPPDAHGGPGNAVWHSFNSTGEWMLSAGGGDGGEGRFTRDGTTIENLSDSDLILKWDHRVDNYGWWAFDGSEAGPIPFGLYERDPGTGEETRLIPLFFSSGGTVAAYDISAETSDPFSGLPATDWCYAYRFDPEIATYEEWVMDASDGSIETDPTTVELFARMIVATQTGDFPPVGTVIQFSTNKSGVVAGSGFDRAVPIAWPLPSQSAPCFDPEFEVFRDGDLLGSTFRLDFLDTTVPVNGQAYEYQIRTRNPMTDEVSELSIPRMTTPRDGGYVETSGLCVAPPVIDGIVEILEWGAATEIDATPYVGGPAGRVRIMNNKSFLYLAVEDGVSAQEVRVYVDANGDGVYGTDALEGVVVLDSGTPRFVRLSGQYPDVVEVEVIENPVWLLAASTERAVEMRLTLRVGPLKDRPESDVVSLFVNAPTGVAIYPQGPASVLSQSPQLFADIQLADAASLPGFSVLPRPLLRVGTDVSFAVEVAFDHVEAVTCLYRALEPDFGTKTPSGGAVEAHISVEESASIEERGSSSIGSARSGTSNQTRRSATYAEIVLGETAPGVFSVTIPGNAVTAAGLVYRIRVVCEDGRTIESEEVRLETASTSAVSDLGAGDIAARFANLSTSASFPNPFRESTNIVFRVPSAQSVSAAIYEVDGRRVCSLRENEPMSTGIHIVEWDGRDDHRRALGSGIYFYRIVGESFEYNRPITLLGGD